MSLDNFETNENPEDSTPFDMSRVQAEAELKAFETSESKIEVKSETTVEETKSEETIETTEGQYSELELEQMEKGWDPKKEDGVSAKEFKRVGEIIEAKRKASREAQLKSKEVEELTKTVKQLVEHNKSVQKASYEQALRDLEAKKIEKIQEGDVSAVKAIEVQQENIKAQENAQQAQVQPAPQFTPDSEVVQAFKEECKLFLQGTTPSDLAMQAYVRMRAEDYMKNNPTVDESVAIESIKIGLREAFPHKFENVNKKKPALTATSTTSSKSATTVSVSRLSHEQRSMFEQIKHADPSYDLKTYIEQLELTGRLSK